LTTYISQGSVAIDLKGGGSYNLSLKKNHENLSTFAEVVAKIKVAHLFSERRCRIFDFSARDPILLIANDCLPNLSRLFYALS